jgi:hypothetical protein
VKDEDGLRTANDRGIARGGVRRLSLLCMHVLLVTKHNTQHNYMQINVAAVAHTSCNKCKHVGATTNAANRKAEFRIGISHPYWRQKERMDPR